MLMSSIECLVVIYAVTFHSVECISFFDWLDFTANVPDVNNDLLGLIKSKGYPAENFEVQTEDGYILQITHIPHGRHDSSPSSGKPVVLLMHGMFAAPDQWVANFPEQSLGFILADAGYDVWMGSARGSPDSMKHVSLSTKSNKFWDFSWEEIGTKDLPAFVDFILQRTGEEKHFLIGHSMGTTESFVFLSLRSEYNSKIRTVLALAPVAFMAHTTGISKLYLPFGSMFDQFVQTFSYGEMTFSSSVRRAAEILCGSKLSMLLNCDFLFFIDCGFESPRQFNESRFPVYTAHVLGAASTKQVAHYSQSAVSKGFARFDYGYVGNKQRYGQSTPPQFPLEKISAPVALFHSQEDYFADPEDVETLKARLPNVVEDFVPAFSPWTHVDFILAKEAKKYLYDEVLNVLKKYN